MAFHSNKFCFLTVLFASSAIYSFSQCNVNEKYDKIVSGYHSSIAIKDNGTYSVWGSSMSRTGAGDVLAPQDIDNINYPPLTGTVLKAALGGSTGGTDKDQAVLLTTDGLWAWGVVSSVLKNTIATAAAFSRITSPAGANGYGLPTGVTPGDVASLFATYQTLVILTTSGNVWVLTQTSLALEANGGTVTSAGSSVWKQVKINSSTNLTNVIAVRGQVSNLTYNAFMALTSSGEVYTWGNSTYIGNGSSGAARHYATLMTLPSEFSSSNKPKMIGITGGNATTGATRNTYYILSNSGSLYSLGENNQKQCGDFTTTERKSWVNAKVNSTTNFSNINVISSQEHNSSYPGIAAITTSGALYTWGNNNNAMLGRTDNGTTGGTIGTSYDPGMPVIFASGSDKAVSAELGGHTLVYLKEGSSQFCYVGHRTDGSMGDGSSSTSALGAYYASCSSTPVLNICGYVPVAASAVNSSISASPTSIIADGISASTITVQLKNASGTNLTSSGGVVAINADIGTMGAVTDNNNGTYTAALTSAVTPGSASVSFSINGTAGSNTASVEFTSTLPLTWLQLFAYRQNQIIKISWTTSNELNTSSFDVERSTNGIDWTVIAGNISAVNHAGTNTYQNIDSTYNTQSVFYRIKQKDANGSYIYSSVQRVSAIAAESRIAIYPVPAGKDFYLSNIQPSALKNVQLINSTGALIKKWNRLQPSYDIQDLSRGIYLLRLEMNDGEIQVLRLIKN